jgi:polyhydroxyalkanoate synthesis regulator phasin
MMDLFKSGILAGLGAAVITRDKIEERMKRLVEEGKITREEAGRITEELLESGRGQWEEVRRRLVEALASGIEPLGLARREEYEELKRRVTEIEEQRKVEKIRLNSLEERVSEIESSGGDDSEKSA